MKTLIIAEKPSVGRDIARVLNCKQKGDNYLYSDEYVISWAIGHLATLKEPEDYDPALKKWRMNDLPIIPQTMGLKALPKTSKQLNLLKKMLNSKEIDTVICATDSGREGELIFRYIYQWANCKKPVKRLWISSLTDAAISDGLAKMKDGKEYDNLYASARCRAEADWLVGMNATRAYTIKCGELLPMGRVQTPTLALLVNRHHEIAAFVPENYWEVKADFSTENDDTYKGIYINKDGEERVKTEEEANAIAEKVKGATGTVESVETEEKRQLPPQLFDLTELQRECNRKLGLSAQKTLSIAQSLYEKHKMITYPRTDSRYLSKDMVPKLKPTLESLPTPYDTLAAHVLGLPQLPTGSRIVNDAKVTDHHAIIPTGSKKPLSVLSAEEKAVYDRILRNFLAVFYEAYVYDVTTVITRAADETFRSRGKVDRQLGWKVVYAHEQDTAEVPTPARGKNAKAQDDAETESLPPLCKGAAVTATDTEVLHKKTQPPKPYTEATLLSAMEHAGRFVDDEALKEALKSSGLGTPATRAAMIEKLISSGYVERKKKSLIPTEKGIRLIGIVPPEMRQPETTGKWERGLSRIADGEMDDGRFMESIRKYVTYLVQEAAGVGSKPQK
ncbi:MAG: DNA topoisomerase III [Firmicutes bacterium]|nr:DNA topoisomerase III [Bacillota bacterium]